MEDIPAAQRILMIRALRSEGIVPQFDDVVEAPPKFHTPTTRKMEDY